MHCHYSEKSVFRFNYLFYNKVFGLKQDLKNNCQRKKCEDNRRSQIQRSCAARIAIVGRTASGRARAVTKKASLYKTFLFNLYIVAIIYSKLFEHYSTGNLTFSKLKVWFILSKLLVDDFFTSVRHNFL